MDGLMNVVVYLSVIAARIAAQVIRKHALCTGQASMGEILLPSSSRSALLGKAR